MADQVDSGFLRSAPSAGKLGALVVSGPAGAAIGGGLTNTELRASAVPVTDTANGTLIGAVAETAPASDTASSGTNGRLQRIAQRLTSLIALLPASLGQKAMASSLAVTVASDQSAIATTNTPAAAARTYATPTRQAASATSVTLMASNASRRGLTIQNSSGGAILYVKFGTTATATDCSFELAAGQYYEMSAAMLYTGRVDGIWATASGGSNTTEIT